MSITPLDPTDKVQTCDALNTSQDEELTKTVSFQLIHHEAFELFVVEDVILINHAGIFSRSRRRQNDLGVSQSRSGQI